MAADGGDARRRATGDRNAISSPIALDEVTSERLCAEGLHEAIDGEHRDGDGGSTYRGLEKRSGIPHQKIHAMATPLSGLVAKSSVPARLAIRWHEIMAAKLRALLAPSSHDLRDSALDASQSAGNLAGRVREALRDGHYDLREIAAIEADAYAGKGHFCAVLAECARLRAKAGAP